MEYSASKSIYIISLFPTSRDPLHIKFQVYGVLICEFIQTALVAHDVVSALASSLGNSQQLDSLHTTWFTIPVSGGITGGVGQLFFAYRIWMLSAELKPTIGIAVLSIASLCSALFSAVAFFQAKTFTALLTGSLGFASIVSWNGIGAICDLSIALTMPYFLMRHGTGLANTHAMVVRLVRLLIETGGLTAIVAILHLCLYASHNQAFVIPGLAMSKIYAITMLVILNNRLRIEGGRFNQEEEASLPISFDRTGRQRNSRTNIIVSNGRLTFQLADTLPASPTNTNGVDHDSILDGIHVVKSEVDLNHH